MSASQPTRPVITSLSLPQHLKPSPSLPLLPSHPASFPAHAPPKRPLSPGPPAKRARISPPPPLRPLESLPLPLLLLVAAQTFHAAALALHTPLARRPSEAKAPAYARAWIEYRRLEGAALGALRSLLQCEEASVGVGRLELRARVLMVEILFAMGDYGEAARVISKGISAASQHKELAAFLPALQSLQATLPPISTPPQLKFAKQVLKRALGTTSAAQFPQWSYHLSLQLAALSDFPGALSALRDVEQLALARRDESVLWAARVLVARLAVGAGRADVAREAVKIVGAWMGFESSDPPVEDKGKTQSKDASEVLGPQLKVLGRQLTIQFVLVFCLFMAREGHVKLAKEKLKMAHQLLDEKRLEEGELEGWTIIKINSVEVFKSRSSGTDSPAPSSPHLRAPLSPLSITLQLSPRSTVYAFAFLVSVAVHRDPFGSKPRSTLFANEGLRTIDAKLSGSEALPPLSPSVVRPHLHALASMKMHLSLFSAELATMRSALPSARAHLDTALATARTHSLWDASPAFRSRLTLDEGLLAVAQANAPLAERCFLVVLQLDVPRTALTPLALFSLLSLRLAAGHSPAALVPLAREIILQTSQDPPPALVLVKELAQALTVGEITKSKTHLSEALKTANATLANHAKASILALLANLFLFTRNDQAQKMLAASFNITKGMGARIESRTLAEKEGNVPGDEAVGNVRLGLWVGERLLESYRRNEPSKVKKQEALNAAHRRVLAREPVPIPLQSK